MRRTTDEDQAPRRGMPSLVWDTNTGVAVIVLAAVLVLFILDRAFRGYTV